MLWFCTTTSIATAFTVFDCDSEKTLYAPIDLTEPKACPDPVKDFLPPEDLRVQVIQTDTSVPMMGYQCLVEVTKNVNSCGFTHITYADSWPAFAKQVVILPDQCREAVKTGKIKIDGRIYDAEVGTHKQYNFYSHGEVNNGKCTKTEDFMSEGMVFYASYEYVNININIAAIRGYVDTANNVVTFGGAHSGLTARYMDGVVRDHFAGTIVWNATVPECHETVSEIYLGPATIHKKISGEAIDSVVMVKDQTTKQYAGLVLREPQSVCKMHCYATQITGIMICLLRELDTPIAKASFRASFDLTQANLQMQLSFLHVDTNMRMGQRFEQIQKDLCDLDRRILSNKLQAMSGGRNPYAMMDIYGPGYQIYVAGATAYLSKCAPVEATRVEYGNCTEEIPVRVNKTIRFADPFTMILNDYPTIVGCSDIFPVRWKIQGKWYCATPKAIPCDSPKQLNTTVSTYAPTGNFLEAMGHGAFTAAQIVEHLVAKAMYYARLPTISKFSYNAVENGGRTTARGKFLGGPLGYEDLGSVTYSVGSNLFPAFALFGSAWHAVSTLLLLCILVKVLAGCLWRAWILYRERGFGWWMLGALWSTAFGILRAPVDLFKAAVHNIQQPLHQQDANFRIDDESDDDEATRGDGAPRRRRLYPALFNRFRSKSSDAGKGEFTELNTIDKSRLALQPTAPLSDSQREQLNAVRGHEYMLANMHQNPEARSFGQQAAATSTYYSFDDQAGKVTRRSTGAVPKRTAPALPEEAEPLQPIYTAPRPRSRNSEKATILDTGKVEYNRRGDE